MINIDKQQLKQIKYIKSEINILENQIENLEPTTVTDKVTGSSPFFPYTSMSFSIEGIDLEDYNKKVDRLYKRLFKRKIELLKLQDEANEFIENINDSLVRQIMTLRYICGMSWKNVAREIGGDNTESSVRMLANRYMND